MYLVERSDTSESRGAYLRVAFMTVFALHPEAIMQGRIITSGWTKLLTGKIHRYKRKPRRLSEGGFYDCICTAS